MAEEWHNLKAEELPKLQRKKSQVILGRHTEEWEFLL